MNMHQCENDQKSSDKQKRKHGMVRFETNQWSSEKSWRKHGMVRMGPQQLLLSQKISERKADPTWTKAMSSSPLSPSPLTCRIWRRGWLRWCEGSTAPARERTSLTPPPRPVVMVGLVNVDSGGPPLEVVDGYWWYLWWFESVSSTHLAEVWFDQRVSSNCLRAQHLLCQHHAPAVFLIICIW